MPEPTTSAPLPAWRTSAASQRESQRRRDDARGDRDPSASDVALFQAALYGQRGDGDVDLIGGQHRDFGFMRDQHRVELHTQQLGVFLRQHPGGAGPMIAAAGGVLDQPGRVGEHGDAQHAGLLDGVDARAGAGRGDRLREKIGRAHV